LVNSQGVTNPHERNTKFKDPVFVVAKDFAQGFPIRSGISSATIHHYVPSDSSEVPEQIVNFTEIAMHCNKPKEQVRQCLGRIVRQLADLAKSVLLVLLLTSSLEPSGLHGAT